MKLPDVYLFQIGEFMYFYKTGLLHNVFKEMRLKTNQVHSFTRLEIYFFPARTNIRFFGIRLQGSKFFSSLNTLSWLTSIPEESGSDADSTVRRITDKNNLRSRLTGNNNRFQIIIMGYRDSLSSLILSFYITI